MQKIILKRPLVFFDIEATGLEVATDRIVSLAALKITPDGDNPSKYEMKYWLINPGVEMCAEVIEVHHITNEMAEECPHFDEVAFEIFEFFTDCDVAGFNCRRFDCPMLHEELANAGFDWDWRSIQIVDAGVLWQILDPRTLEAGVKKFCGREHMGAHDAANDTTETMNVLAGMMTFFPQLSNVTNVETLAQMSLREDEVPIDLAGRFYHEGDGKPRYGFGAHRGKLVELDVQLSEFGRSFCHWMLRQSFLTSDTRRVANEFIQKFSPQPEL
jgi:DNA polymerase-3 subunit epsilon